MLYESVLLGGANLMPQPSPRDKAFEIACLQFGIQGTQLSLWAVKGRK